MKTPPALPAAGSHAATWEIHCDGSAVPNPGRMGLGAVLVAPGGAAQHHMSEATTFTGCNNEAEVRALLQALRWLEQQEQVAAGTTTLRVFSDSTILVEQLGAYTVPAIARLAPLFDEARRALQAYAHVDLQWVPRHRNTAADALARAALGLAPKAATPHGHRNKRHKS